MRKISELLPDAADVIFNENSFIIRHRHVPEKTGLRVNVLGMGDVGGTLLLGLKILGAGTIDSIGICDLNENALKRYEAEMNQISLPDDHRAFPKVYITSPEKLFDADAVIFCATKGVPEVLQNAAPGDVRMAQFEGNRPIVGMYAEQGARAGFNGLFMNTTGNPGMAAGGTGDVLTGITAALFAQGYSAFDAASSAVFIHGMAGDRCAARLGEAGMGEGADAQVGTPYLDATQVFGEVVENGKGKKVIIYKYKSKKDYRKKQGHRQPYSMVEITGIGEDKPKQVKPAEAEEAAPAAEAEDVEKAEEAEAAAPEAEDVETAADEQKMPSLKSMKKDELITFAQENNIEIDPKATKAVITEAIEAGLK